MSDQISDFYQEANKLEAELSSLLQKVRVFLDESEQESFYTAESDLCDARECLQDFIEHCQEHIDS